MSKTYSSRPKRRVERVHARLVDHLFTTSSVNTALHSAEDSKTLVRILVDGYIVLATGAAQDVQCTWELAWAINPNSAPVDRDWETDEVVNR